ncbi:MAG: tRNA pseudouridine(13) synthase TruD [Pseudomonadota bacterium]
MIFNFSYAYEQVSTTACFKQKPEDFIVQEQLSFTPDGSGKHAFLWLEKKALNTQYVIKLLSEFTGLAARHIGYAGLKDKQSISRQWFSINLQGLSEPKWQDFSHPDITIKTVTYHNKKLKVGSLTGNDFVILLRDIQAFNCEEIEQRLDKISEYGVPNYFGPQRFGINNQNISKAQDWFEGKIKINHRAQKSIILSAARSYLFNQLLSQRIELYGWHQLINGEVMMLDGTRSIFIVPEQADSETIQRFNEADIHPSLSLWGQGQLKSQAQLYDLENNLKDVFPNWCKGLENKGLKQDRRAMRVLPKNLSFSWLEGKHLQLKFSLARGCYATSILRELVNIGIE